jgi:hypothetical protein
VGVTAKDAAEAGLSPTTFVATTVNVYAVPLLSPETTAFVAAPTLFPVNPPAVDVTV